MLVVQRQSNSGLRVSSKGPRRALFFYSWIFAVPGTLISTRVVAFTARTLSVVGPGFFGDGPGLTLCHQCAVWQLPSSNCLATGASKVPPQSPKCFATSLWFLFQYVHAVAPWPRGRGGAGPPPDQPYLSQFLLGLSRAQPARLNASRVSAAVSLPRAVRFVLQSLSTSGVSTTLRGDSTRQTNGLRCLSGRFRFSSGRMCSDSGAHLEHSDSFQCQPGHGCSLVGRARHRLRCERARRSSEPFCVLRFSS